MNTKQLLMWGLKNKGYDGLCDPENECGCGFDEADALFMPSNDCDECCMMCRPAYRHSDGTYCAKPEECDGGCGL